MLSSHSQPPHDREQWFLTTHWSVVRAAGRGGSESQARAALEKLCRTYWYPLYAFVRRSGHSPHDAEDLVQSFFAQCLEKNYLGSADQAKGRFRTFLLVMLKRFLNHEWAKVRAQKRGGGERPVALDALTAEQRYALEPADCLSADRLYDRRWALTLLETVLRRLEAEQTDSEAASRFAVLKDCLTGGRGDTTHADLARQLNMTEGAVKVAVHRLRRRYRELLEEEIAHTVDSPAQIEEERRHLLAALQGT